MEIDKTPEEEDQQELPSNELTLELPLPRFNAQLAVQNDVLYIYGGTMEKGDREFTFDELHAVDLGKLDGIREIFRREPENWIGEEESDESDDDENLSDEAADEEDLEGDVRMSDAKTKLHAESKRKASGTPNEETPSIDPPAFDDTPDDANVRVEDSLPHPRPFETRREFFQRTGNEWQEALMTSLRWKGIQPETLSVKEIKTKAFEMSEEKWWECREEITALEDEQDAAGIGEVVTLADRAGGDSSIGRRR
jgi:hypothetical protein